MASIYADPGPTSIHTATLPEMEPEPSFWEANMSSIMSEAAGAVVGMGIDTVAPGAGGIAKAVITPAVKVGIDNQMGQETDLRGAAMSAGTGVLSGGIRYGGSELKSYMNDIPAPDMYVEPVGDGSGFGGLDPRSSEYFNQVANNQFRDSQAGYQKTIDDAGRQVVNSNQVIRDLGLDPWYADDGMSQGAMERGQGLLANNPPLQQRPVAIGGEINYPKSTQEFQRLNPEWQNHQAPMGPPPTGPPPTGPPQQPMGDYPMQDPRGYQMQDPNQFNYQQEYNVNNPYGFQPRWV
tara:strand:+ start:2354 stop:3232 length:879 start_codon:yes stop_codon:yes gene_type:complete